MSKTGAWVVGSGLFAALSVADFVQTYALIEGGPAHEANPVAAEWLARHGWAGLAVFKALMCLCVLGIVGLLAVRKSPAAGRVLALGCAVLFGVAVYSRGLIVGERAELAFQDAVARGFIVEVAPADPRWASPGRPPAGPVGL
jgi:hypothetical protein